MAHENVIEKLTAMGLKIGEPAKIRRDDSVMLYPVDGLYLYEVDLHRLAAGDIVIGDLREEYGDDIYPPNPYDQTRFRN